MSTENRRAMSEFLSAHPGLPAALILAAAILGALGLYWQSLLLDKQLASADRKLEQATTKLVQAVDLSTSIYDQAERIAADTNRLQELVTGGSTYVALEPWYGGGSSFEFRYGAFGGDTPALDVVVSIEDGQKVSNSLQRGLPWNDAFAAGTRRYQLNVVQPLRVAGDENRFALSAPLLPPFELPSDHGLGVYNVEINMRNGWVKQRIEYRWDGKTWNHTCKIERQMLGKAVVAESCPSVLAAIGNAKD
jgi:hypothetical protein